MPKSLTASDDKKACPQDESEYKRIKSFLLWGLSIVGTLITIIALAAGFIFFKDRSDMRDSYDRELERYDKYILSMREDAKERQSELAEQYRTQSTAAKEHQLELNEMYSKQIDEMRDMSRSQVSAIINDTREAASRQTEKEISDIFKTDKIQAIIEKNAIGELKDKLPATIAAYMQDLPALLEDRNYLESGDETFEAKLKDYANSKSEFTRDLAVKFLNEANGLFQQEIGLSNSEYEQKFKSYGIGINGHLHVIVNNHFPTDESDKKNLELLIKIVKSRNNEYMLFPVAWSIGAINNISGKNFTMSDREAISTWYESLIR